jgi:hypothetical protein
MMIDIQTIGPMIKAIKLFIAGSFKKIAVTRG